MSNGLLDNMAVTPRMWWLDVACSNHLMRAVELYQNLPSAGQKVRATHLLANHLYRSLLRRLAATPVPCWRHPAPTAAASLVAATWQKLDIVRAKSVWLCRSMMKRNWKYKCILRHLCVPEWCPPLRQFRLRPALQSRVTMTVLIKTNIENTTAPSVKTMSEIILHELEPPSKQSRNDTFQNATESNRRTRESHQHKHFWVGGLFATTTQMSSMPCKLTNIVICWYCFHGVSVRASVYQIFCSRV